MAKLGDGFPAQKRRAFVEKTLVPGCVVRIAVKFPETAKPKLLVLVADDDPDYFLFIINSEIHPFIRARQDLLRCQVRMDTADHDFLRHDSFLACHEILRLRRDEVIQELMKDLGGVKGRVSDNVKDEIIAAVKFARTLSPAEKSKILASLG